MKAVVIERYGGPDVLQLREVDRPTANANEVLIRVHATTVSSADRRIRSATFPTGFGILARLVLGVFRPRRRVLGGEFAGEIVAIGEDVTKFQVGDRVFGYPGSALGCYVEYRTMPEDGKLASIPEGLSYEKAAALSFGGSTALNFLRDKGRIQAGDRVLIIGASGSVGSAGVQLARHFGAHVVGVCSTRNLDLVRSLGADEVIDYTQQDFTKNGDTYDVIFDTVGQADFRSCRDSLSDGGRLLLAVSGLPDLTQIPWAALTGTKRVLTGDTPGRVEDLLFLKELAEAGAYEPVIDRHYALHDVADAHAYVDTGRKRGNVVLRVTNMNPSSARGPSDRGWVRKKDETSRKNGS